MVKALLLQFKSVDEGAPEEYRSFLRSTGLSEGELRALDAVGRPAVAADLQGTDALFIGGSKYSVHEGAPNQDAAVAFLREARMRRLPIFGCCFGGQLVAHAFGGEVIRDEGAEEWGTFRICSSEDAWTDPLFIDQPDEFWAQCAHHDRIARLPSLAHCLASSERCPVQAFVIPGTGIYGVQFHPERNKADFEERLERNLKAYPAYAEKFLAARQGLTETFEAERLLAKFTERIVRGAVRK